VIGNVTIPSKDQQQQRQADETDRRERRSLSRHSHLLAPWREQARRRPQIEDVLLNTYDHEVAEQFGHTLASNATWIDAAAFPAVFYMPGLTVPWVGLALGTGAAERGMALGAATGRRWRWARWPPGWERRWRWVLGSFDRCCPRWSRRGQ
jgi:hypothetical protein